MQKDVATAAGSSALREPLSLAPATLLVMVHVPTLLLYTACRARHADGAPSVYPMELTVLSYLENKKQCIWTFPEYQCNLSPMEADLHMQRLGYNWQLPLQSIRCSGSKSAVFESESATWACRFVPVQTLDLNRGYITRPAASPAVGIFARRASWCLSLHGAGAAYLQLGTPCLPVAKLCRLQPGT